MSDKAFPPRYFVGKIVFAGGQELKGMSMQMVPVSERAALLIITDPKDPFAGLVPGSDVHDPLESITYSINAVTGDNFPIETLKHDFENPDTFLSTEQGLPVLVNAERDLFKLVPSNYVFKLEEGEDVPYPVIQFIS